MKNPFLNALAAALYIVVVVFVISSITSDAHEETLLIPITMLSLLVLSVSVMGLLFFYEPARLFLENKNREAILFFVKTVGTFACFVIILIALLFYTPIL
ncbi:hypothetical protein A2917_01060 [Candidatus Nomurabacteria bacterium RIFCSPLOWO2_01_FULL_42_17]|uniref:DUF5671 domain-containing protein n=1 Tax=Candidatus Nomurabacteria bacterium RIFCSPLOWO2_01_FULL_42_17 TaxID=1801780 RepID=A0A1F6XM75_9BACT|nr:MAG: hypothetical protein A2917_01060 [Candidatus Nomurabacteria bacterium RIFCSPLOWO2_01_FULL_42_17]